MSFREPATLSGGPVSLSFAEARGRLPLLLAAIVAVRVIFVDQPITENYVGRQIPTAMVARNLERGSGFLKPQLDTAPFPNYFLVEPPVYELTVVWLHRFSGWRLEPCGRLVSALATALGGWGLFELIVRREGVRVAQSGLVAFSLFPVTIRYGRTFQPDALMLGGVLAGLACWDRFESGRSWWWTVAGWLFLVLGFAAKVTAAFVLAPLALAIVRRRSWHRLAFAVAALGPALIWYLWAGHLMESGTGSLASAENRTIWSTVLGVSALGSRQTLANLGRFLVIRAFTPVLFALGIWGLCCRRENRDRFDFWRVWGLAASLTLAVLAAKLHHEYYLLILAPAIAAGAGRAWSSLETRQRWLAWSVALGAVICSAGLSCSTWRTPPEWKDLETAARLVRDVVPEDTWLAAPEPLLYHADRRGCRLEFTPSAAARAANEWPRADRPSIHGPLDLIDFYRAGGARFVADVAAAPGDETRKALHEAIRRSYKVRVDTPSVIIAELPATGASGYGQ